MSSSTKLLPPLVFLIPANGHPSNCSGLDALSGPFPSFTPHSPTAPSPPISNPTVSHKHTGCHFLRLNEGTVHVQQSVSSMI